MDSGEKVKSGLEFSMAYLRVIGDLSDCKITASELLRS